MSNFDLSRAAFAPSLEFLAPAFYGAFIPLMLESFLEDGGLVENPLKLPDGLGRGYTDRFINCYFKERE